ncbi:MAG: RtcB family protein [Halanaerobiales bacterium]|nr:RtcB family protein [Halanaerobiales bacterium]
MYYYKFSKEKDRKCDIYIFANQKIYKGIDHKSINQLFNASKLPKAKRVVGMPDIHVGYGLPIGGILAVDNDDGIVSPGAVGFDINCGVRLLKTNLNHGYIKNDIKHILNLFKKNIPAGLGQSSDLNFNIKQFEKIVTQGVPYIKKNYGNDDIQDLDRIEDKGCFPGAEFNNISKKAVKRGISQLGSLGSGNHFIELQYVDRIYEKQSNFKQGQITIMIHTGSRGFGHQIASDYIDLAVKMANKNNREFPVKNLAYFPIKSIEGKQYLSAMAAAANYAYVNRQLLTRKIRELIKKIYPEIELDLYYDLTHNIARSESHKINNSYNRYLVHRKGATRLDFDSYAFIPGSMGTASYIIKSANSESTKESLTSIAHGSGRILGRREAKRTISKEEHLNTIKKVEVTSSSGDSLIDESPLVYKDVDQIIESIVETKLARPYVKLSPLAVLKG